tara:strand:- start:403 stop:570 length:168 start_codon:yes stop_codon:yes gene_type:complete
MSDKETQEQSTKDKIVNFIDKLSDENYAAANKYLQSAIEDKIENRIRQANDKPLF